MAYSTIRLRSFADLEGVANHPQDIDGGVGGVASNVHLYEQQATTVFRIIECPLKGKERIPNWSWVRPLLHRVY